MKVSRVNASIYQRSVEAASTSEFIAKAAR